MFSTHLAYVYPLGATHIQGITMLRRFTAIGALRRRVAIWMFATLPFNARHDQIKITFLRLQIADRRSKRIKRQPASQRSSPVPFPFVCFGLFLAGLPHSCPCLDKSSLVQSSSSSCSTLYQSLSLCRTLHNCRLLIDRSNNVMDAQPAFDATTRGNPRCSSTRTYVYPGMDIDSGMGIAVAMAMAIGMACYVACCMAVSLCFPPHMVRAGPWLGFIFSSLPASGTWEKWECRRCHSGHKCTIIAH